MPDQDFNLDPVQSTAVERTLAVVRKGGSIKVLGKAGTGKTTTGLAIVSRLTEAGYKVVCCSYTNKAVNRMVEVGYPSRLCRTLNRLLYSTGIVIDVDGYQFSEDEADVILRTKPGTEVAKIQNILVKRNVPEEKRKEVLELIRKGRGSREAGIALKSPEQLAKDGLSRDTVIVLDELSMCPMGAADDVQHLFKSVVYIGDPGQLPPVNSPDTCKYLATDDTVTLKTVHRVQGNERLLDIIYSLDEGKLPAGTSDITIDGFHSLVEQDFQFICYTNNAVAWLNEETRRTLGFDRMEPQTDEPLITVTRTKSSRSVAIDEENRDWFLNNEARLTGQYRASRGQAGGIYIREDGFGDLTEVVLYRMIQKNMILRCAGSPVAHQDSDIPSVPVTVDGDRNAKTWLVRTAPFWRMKQARKRAFRNVGNSMRLDFAYAITAHKAQGSEWPRVAVMVRKLYRKDMGNEELTDEVKRWNYTAASRGRDDIQLFTSIIGCPYG